MTEIQRAPRNSTPSLQERTEHRVWIKGRAATLLSHYWREDDDPALLAAIGKDWADVLEGIPQEYIQRACIQYQRDEPRRKPTPGAIYEIARALMPKPKSVAPDFFTPMRPPEERCSPEAAAEIMARAGFKVRRME
jgi:hypothetical protein